MLNFDHNATSPWSDAAREALLNAVESLTGNPSSLHRLGKRAEKAMEDARQALAELLGCHPLDLVWTGGATEAANLVWHHLRQSLPEDTEVWCSPVEHPCVLEPARHFFGERLRLLPCDDHGVVTPEMLESPLKNGPRPGLIAVMAANNETGVLQPWKALAQCCREAGVPFFCDASQWIGKLPASGLGECDWLIGCGHKFGGPQGVGFLKAPSDAILIPLHRGGPQEEKRRAGTENLPALLAFTAALKERESRIAASQLQEKIQLRDHFIARLLQALPGVRILGHDQPSLWNTVSILLPEVSDCRFRWVVKLDKSGCAVSTGSACSSGTEKPSHVLTAMGLSPNEASRVLRISSGWETSAEDWDQLLDHLLAVAASAGLGS